MTLTAKQAANYLLVEVADGETKQVSAVRDDVALFAIAMSLIMDQKNAEREAAGLPHYRDQSYSLERALLELQEQIDKLLNAALYTNREIEACKAAVHVANYCMIISRKLWDPK